MLYLHGVTRPIYNPLKHKLELVHNLQHDKKRLQILSLHTVERPHKFIISSIRHPLPKS